MPALLWNKTKHITRAILTSIFATLSVSAYGSPHIDLSEVTASKKQEQPSQLFVQVEIPGQENPDEEVPVFDRGPVAKKKPETKSITRKTETCSVGVIASVILECDDTRIESHNFAAGFDEIVLPDYCKATINIRPDPDSNRPFSGKLSASWSVADNKKKVVKTFKRQGKYTSRAELVKGWPKKHRKKTILPDGTEIRGERLKPVSGNRPYTEYHSIKATWTPDRGEPCALEKTYPVTRVKKHKVSHRVNLPAFVNDNKQKKYASVDRPEKKNGTRVFAGMPGRYGKAVSMPVGIYWDRDDTCCQVKRATPKIIQFARAGISGPNGHQGKPWTLDIKSSEVKNALKDSKSKNRKKTGIHRYDPTYTNNPRSDRDGAPQNGSGSKRSPIDPTKSDIVQWDAPGMPQSLYDRLRGATKPTQYRQQFLTLLVCRPPNKRKLVHTATHYLDKSKISQFVVTTVIWEFPGNGGKPTQAVTYKSDICDSTNCPSLNEFLKLNNLLEPYLNPSDEKARGLSLMDEDAYKKLKKDLDSWQNNPLGEVKKP